MTMLHVLHTNLWRSHPYLLCPEECWDNMFPIVPSGVDAVRLANFNAVQSQDECLPLMFANAPTSSAIAYIIIRDGKYRPSEGRGDIHSVIVPPDHPQLDYLKAWVREADKISELHERALRWLAYTLKETKTPVRTLRKKWNFMADLASSHRHAYNYASPTDCDMDKSMMEQYESIIAKGILNPPIDENRTVVHPSNLASIFRSHI